MKFKSDLSSLDDFGFDVSDLWTEVWLGLMSESELFSWFRPYPHHAWSDAKLRFALEQLLIEQGRLVATESCTHTDALIRVFDRLNRSGIIAEPHCGSSLSDGLSGVLGARSDIFQRAFEFKKMDSLPEFIGYCYFHAQDSETLIPNLDFQTLLLGNSEALDQHSNEPQSQVQIPESSLMLAFGVFDDHTDLPASEIGQRICQELTTADLAYTWSGSPQTRIELSKFKWTQNSCPVNRFRWCKDLEPDPVDSSSIRVGQKYQVIRGAFKNQIGRVKAVDASSNQATVILNVFGREVEIQLAISDLALDSAARGTET